MSEETVYWCLIGNDEVTIYGIFFGGGGEGGGQGVRVVVEWGWEGEEGGGLKNAYPPPGMANAKMHNCFK